MTRLFQLAATTEATSPYENSAVVGTEFQSRARREGTEFDAIALEYLESAGARVVQGRHFRHHYPVDAEIVAPTGQHFLVLAHGNIGDSSSRPGLQRTDTFAKVAHRIIGLSWHKELPVVVVTSHLPLPRSTCSHQLADLHGKVGGALADVVATTADMPGFQRLSRVFHGEALPPSLRTAPWHNPGHNMTLFDLLEPEAPHA
jgi:hypothetical protein